MVGCYEQKSEGGAKAVLALGRTLALVGALSACSSVPDAVNPVEWYRGTRDLIVGKDAPEPVKSSGDAKKPATVDNREDAPKGLVADRGTGLYAEPVRREVAPTRPLARRSETATQIAQAAPAGAIAAHPLPSAEATPVVAMNMTPPPPAGLPDSVPVPGRPRRLQQQFEMRLNESAQQAIRPGMVEMPTAVAASYGADAPVHLVPPGSGKKARRAGGGKGLAAPPPPEPAASFQVATVDFAADQRLSRLDRAALADAARLYKQTGGVIRVIGHAPALSLRDADAVRHMLGGLGAAQDRANLVARELSRLGVPAGKIMVAADPDPTQSGAQVFLDVM